MKRTCTPYDGNLTVAQQQRLLVLLWSAMKPVPGVDQVETGEGTKTQTGLLVTIEAIITTPCQLALADIADAGECGPLAHGDIRTIKQWARRTLKGAV